MERVNLFLFKFFLRISLWFNREKTVKNHLESILVCRQRQFEMDQCIRPRTETYEWHTSNESNRLHYTDYDERQY